MIILLRKRQNLVLLELVGVVSRLHYQTITLAFTIMKPSCNLRQMERIDYDAKCSTKHGTAMFDEGSTREVGLYKPQGLTLICGIGYL